MCYFGVDWWFLSHTGNTSQSLQCHSSPPICTSEMVMPSQLSEFSEGINNIGTVDKLAIFYGDQTSHSASSLTASDTSMTRYKNKGDTVNLWPPQGLQPLPAHWSCLSLSNHPHWATRHTDTSVILRFQPVNPFIAAIISIVMLLVIIALAPQAS